MRTKRKPHDEEKRERIRTISSEGSPLSLYRNVHCSPPGAHPALFKPLNDSAWCLLAMRVSTSNQGLCQRLTWSTSSIFKAFIVSPWCLQLIKGDARPPPVHASPLKTVVASSSTSTVKHSLQWHHPSAGRPACCPSMRGGTWCPYTP
ncbi:uncharacterized protein LOC132194800 [Neocloeon triangulifer]|uniref:uncharacterized protein LOC132194800 n=1 Tax=Neocloeon triangulifer TaxID=2078957 RepID=UPI00286F5CAB|nr:uncharacterized protein LOC132194800 [Neocloeon triangulifer]